MKPDSLVYIADENAADVESGIIVSGSSRETGQ